MYFSEIICYAIKFQFMNYTVTDFLLYQDGRGLGTFLPYTYMALNFL